KFRVNSALAFLYKVGWPLGVGFTFLLIDTYVISIPESVSVLLIIPAMAGFVLLLRFLPMEEEK
ncbi:MAG: hypothetical protein IIV81_01920, partial [Clostridia bacterium]|nr:hypothetical protein [Clostridia bacterium]